MKLPNCLTALTICLALTSFQSFAADFVAQQEGNFIIKDFKFHDGSVLPQLRQHYVTLGDPKNLAILVMHGTTGSGKGLLNPAFGGQLFGPGQPFDAAKYFIILPDSIGAGGSSKPSDGLRAKFPRYNYDDLVIAQYRLLTEGLAVKHVRLVIGNSMGGMETWMFGEAYPDFMDALVPMASQPTEMSSRNWIMRRMIIDAVRLDPDWHDGNYTTQPKAVRVANAYYGILSIGGTIAYQKMAPTRALTDKLLESRLDAPFKMDANDYMYQWDASRDYNASLKLDKITAPLLAINSADDERNPPETGNEVEALRHVKNGKLFLIQASAQTRGHGTTGMAKFWGEQVRTFLQTAPTH